MRARRLAVQDRVDRDGEAVVLVARQVVRLSALATELLDECHEWTEARPLSAVLTERFGPPPDGRSPLELTEDALRELARQGLVELD